jgi:hypothetical protein
VQFATGCGVRSSKNIYIFMDVPELCKWLNYMNPIACRLSSAPESGRRAHDGRRASAHSCRFEDGMKRGRGRQRTVK